MSSAIDMTLDDLIKKNKQSKSNSAKSNSARSGGRGGRARNSSSSGLGGPSRRNFKRRGNRPAPYSVAKVQAPVQDMFADHASAYPVQAVRAAAIETGTKLFISNLDYGVSNDDIKELFSEAGDLKRFGVHYDRSGRSKGTADVVFARKTDALAAVKRYNNVQLDGKPMKIEIVGANISNAVASNSFSLNGNRNGALRSAQGRGRARGAANNSRRATRGGRGGGRGIGGRGRGKKVSAEDLDADLEKYHSEAMETN